MPAVDRSTSTARSATCARAPMSRRRGRSARSSCSPSPAPTGGATRSGRCSSGSTGRSGRRRRSWTCTSSGARRRRSATTASSASQLDLYSFHDVSPGSAFWHPKGQRIWRTLEAAMRELQERRGYEEVSTPILVHEKLWHQSGHWDHLRRQHVPLEAEGQTFSLKPMNCPESTFIYRSPPAVLPRPAPALQRIRPAAPQRALGFALRAHPRPPVHPGRRATSTSAPTSWPTRSRRSSARSARRTAGSASSPGSRSRPSRTRRSATRRSGSARSS